MVDFGADESFADSEVKIKEHYGIEVPISAVASTTERHAKQMFMDQEIANEVPNNSGVNCIIMIL